MQASEIRSKYLNFFQSHGHAILPSAPLVPENDPSVLFNTAGMQPLVPYLLGRPHPMGKRIVDVQKCVRTGDIDEVGDNTHLTFFEMLGNWSLGDYFKQESITWSWEFLTSPDWLALSPEMLSVTVFEGDENAPRDDESAEIWKSVGVPDSRIAYLPAEDNWWAAGPTGPCGPDTEIFYWVGEGVPVGNKGTHPEQWMEIWNNVFMQYNRIDADTLEKLPAPCVDTGMGLERTAAILGQKTNIFETDLFLPILQKIEEVRSLIDNTGNTVPEDEEAKRIVADHMRAAVFIVSEGIHPGKTDREYIPRKLIRRAAFKMHNQFSNYDSTWVRAIVETTIKTFHGTYPEIEEGRDEIVEIISKEVDDFYQKVLPTGSKLLNSELEKLSSDTSVILSGKVIFDLLTTYGFPVELTRDITFSKGFDIDLNGFEEEFKQHQELSRTASAGKFKGGLADNSAKVTAFHTATHLMLAALRKELGEDVHQAGSNITEERTRFDFTYPEKVSREILDRIETYVNTAIQAGATVSTVVMDKDEAHRSGVEGSFWEKYPDKVTVYQVVAPDGTIYSQELCGGPHVTNTGEISPFGRFRITKEEASSAGVRRIKAIFE